MSPVALTSTTLEALVALTRKREALQAELSKVESDIQSALGAPQKTDLIEGVAKGRKPRPVKKPNKRILARKDTATKSEAPAVEPTKPARRGKRGALKDTLLAELKAAGAKGISVKELASKLGIKNQNLHVWFATTGKAIDGLKKTGPGAWSYSG